MKKRRIKRELVYGLYSLAFLLLLGTIYYVGLQNKNLNTTNDNYTYVSRLFDTEIRSVVSTPVTIIRPYSNPEVQAIKNFYDYKSEETAQENSIINYDNTYIQNNGTIYAGPEEPFEVRSSLEGKVISIKEDKLLGKTITIEHENNIVTVYQGLSEVIVKENDQIGQATIIGKSGKSNLIKDKNNILLFEIKVNGKYINPEMTYDKQISEIINQ